MSLLEHNDPILHELNDKIILQEPRDYLGLSQIGHPCHRYLQHYHYWSFPQQITKRIQRLFDFGHNAEPIMIKDLKDIGIIVSEDQYRIIGTAGHWKGHIDGKGIIEKDTVAEKLGITEKQFIIEFKTHNDKSFKELKAKQVKNSKPAHYAQMQAYMTYSALKLALYMAINKNTSEYYIEWVPIDSAFCEEQQRKEMEIIASDVLLPRIGNNSKTWHECKYCDAKSVCFGDSKPQVTCRSCKYVDVLNNGQWSCQILDSKLSRKQQKTACNLYELAEMFDD